MSRIGGLPNRKHVWPATRNSWADPKFFVNAVIQSCGFAE